MTCHLLVEKHVVTACLNHDGMILNLNGTLQNLRLIPFGIFLKRRAYEKYAIARSLRFPILSVFVVSFQQTSFFAISMSMCSKYILSKFITANQCTNVIILAD